MELAKRRRQDSVGLFNDPRWHMVKLTVYCILDKTYISGVSRESVTSSRSKVVVARILPTLVGTSTMKLYAENWLSYGNAGDIKTWKFQPQRSLITIS